MIHLIILFLLPEHKIYLPKAKPDLYVIKRPTNPNNPNSSYEYWLVGFYNFWENGLDQTILGNKMEFSLYGSPVPFIYGRISEEVFYQLQGNGVVQGVCSPDSLPMSYEDLKKQDRNINQPLRFDNSNPDFIHISKGKIKWYWDPSTGRIEAGIEFIDPSNGKKRVLKLKLDNWRNDNIDNLPEVTNRWLSVINNAPNVLVDVDEKVEDLVKQGYEEVTPLALGFGLYDQLLATQILGENSYLDILSAIGDTELSQYLIDRFNNKFNLINNSLIVAVPKSVTDESGEEQPIKIYKFDKKGNKIGEIELPANMVLGIEETGFTLAGEQYLQICEIKGVKYLLRLEDTFPLKASSNLKLVLEELAIVASFYGGFKLLKLPFVREKIMSPTLKILQAIVQLLSK